MYHFAIKNSKDIILGFTVSSNPLSAKVKIQDTRRSTWYKLYMDGYRVVRVKIYEIQ